MAEEKKVAREDWGTPIEMDGGRILLYPDKVIPEFTGPRGTAVAAVYRNDLSQNLMAIVPNKGLLPRIEFVNSIKAIDTLSVLRLREGGVIDWPADGTRYYAFIYDRPLTGRYWQTLNEQHSTMSEDALKTSFIAPLVNGLLEFQRMGFMHGAIRPTNIFWREGSTTPPQLGESISTPAGFGQDIIFETIERAQCEPIARGTGYPSDDCYAFGITLAMVILGCNPYEGMDAEAVIKSKMEKGTFNSIIGKRRLPTDHIELLRGLLYDDPRQRWTADELEQWLSGRRQTPKSSDSGKRATRHISVADKEYWQTRPLADALSKNFSEALKIIEDGSLEKWLTRSYVDSEKAKNLSEAIHQLKEGGKTAHYQEQLLARACIILDPSGPIHYRGLSVMPTGVATMFADAVIKGSNVQNLSEIISCQLVTFWVNMQKEAKVDLVPLAQQFERLRPIIERSSFGNGVERAAYELNPTLPCLSPLVRKEFVITPKKLLMALEKSAAGGLPSSEPMDRHIAAFLAARDKRRESWFASLAPGVHPMKRGLALAALYGEMQYRFGPDHLPKVASWIMPMVEPCIKRFLSGPLQTKVRKQAQEASKRGDISLLLQMIDDPDRVHKDEQEFLQARLMYQGIRREMTILEASLKDRSVVTREMGKPVAATLASLLAILLIAITLGRAFLDSLM